MDEPQWNSLKERRRRFYAVVGPEVEALIEQADDVAEDIDARRHRLRRLRAKERKN